jgi:hypothetical protein
VASGSKTGAAGACEDRRPDIDSEVDRPCHGLGLNDGRSINDGAEEVEWRAGIFVRDNVRRNADAFWCDTGRLMASKDISLFSDSRLGRCLLENSRVGLIDRDRRLERPRSASLSRRRGKPKWKSLLVQG